MYSNIVIAFALSLPRLALEARWIATRLDYYFTRVRNQNIQTISYNRIIFDKLNGDYDMQ